MPEHPTHLESYFSKTKLKKKDLHPHKRKMIEAYWEARVANYISRLFCFWAGKHKIRLNLDSLQQMQNSVDPSPFYGYTDMDNTAMNFFLEEAENHPYSKIRLYITLRQFPSFIPIQPEEPSSTDDDSESEEGEEGKVDTEDELTDKGDHKTKKDKKKKKKKDKKKKKKKNKESEDQDPRLLAAQQITQEMIHSFFFRKAKEKYFEFKRMIWTGLKQLVVGLIFLICCLSLAAYLAQVSAGKPNYFFISDVLSQSFVIIGWVALWNPATIFLYGWWDVLGTVMLYLRMTTIEIRLTMYEDEEELELEEGSIRSSSTTSGSYLEEEEEGEEEEGGEEGFQEDGSTSKVSIPNQDVPISPEQSQILRQNLQTLMNPPLEEETLEGEGGGGDGRGGVGGRGGGGDEEGIDDSIERIYLKRKQQQQQNKSNTPSSLGGKRIYMGRKKKQHVRYRKKPKRSFFSGLDEDFNFLLTPPQLRQPAHQRTSMLFSSASCLTPYAPRHHGERGGGGHKRTGHGGNAQESTTTRTPTTPATATTSLSPSPSTAAATVSSGDVGRDGGGGPHAHFELFVKPSPMSSSSSSSSSSTSAAAAIPRTFASSSIPSSPLVPRIPSPNLPQEERRGEEAETETEELDDDLYTSNAWAKQEEGRERLVYPMAELSEEDSFYGLADEEGGAAYRHRPVVVQSSPVLYNPGSISNSYAPSSSSSSSAFGTSSTFVPWSGNGNNGETYSLPKISSISASILPDVREGEDEDMLAISIEPEGGGDM